MNDYQDFLKQKSITDIPTGFEPGNNLPAKLFDFQRDVVTWACRGGRRALFEDCGLGKTPQQLAWAQQVVENTSGQVIVLAPLGVTRQTVREGAKFGIESKTISDQSEVDGPGIYVTNYEKMHRIDLSEYDGLVADESSILKSYDGATRNDLIERAAMVPNKLACTATPAPNDYMELGNHSEFLGVMSRTEMLATFFTHDGGETSKWRLKGHAEADFWKWICSWAVNIRKPSDIGYDDGNFILPELRFHEHIVQTTHAMDGYLFALPASTMDERRKARRASLEDRVKVAADLATSDKNQWVLWCDLNSESHALAKAIGAAEIEGSTPEDERERITMGFLDGSIRCVVTKPSIWAFGLNLQQCFNTAFVGLSDSYEQLYQAVRRFWRFGQTRPVNAHIIISELEGAVLANIKRKEADARRMADEMVRHMADISSVQIKGSTRQTETYNPTVKMKLPNWL